MPRITFALMKQALLLNLAMLCIATSGAFGKGIALAPANAIWWRAALAVLVLGAYCRWRGFSFSLTPKRRPQVILSGVLLAGHWVTYFYALQLSNVAVGMLSLFTYPVLTAFLEPILLKSRFEVVHLFMGALVMAGVYFLVPAINFGDQMTQGALFGLLSALIYSLRNLLLKRQVNTTNGSILMFYQVLVTVILLIPVPIIYRAEAVVSQWPYLLGLAVLTTAVGHTLFLSSFRHFSITTASIISGIQPVYGIIIAFFLLGEVPSGRSVIGGLLIISTVILESFRSLKASPGDTS